MVLDVQKLLDEHIQVAQLSKSLLPELCAIAEKTVSHLRKGAKILFCGNGGSAADAQHYAAELVGRFHLERPAIAAIALTTDTSALTGIANDYSYDVVFARQLEALCNPGDVVVLLSTSGNSKNLLEAAKMAKAKGAYVIALLGKDGGKLKDLVDSSLVVPSNSTPRIQEIQFFLGHTFCEWIELAMQQ